MLIWLHELLEGMQPPLDVTKASQNYGHMNIR